MTLIRRAVSRCRQFARSQFQSRKAPPRVAIWRGGSARQHHPALSLPIICATHRVEVEMVGLKRDVPVSPCRECRGAVAVSAGRTSQVYGIQADQMTTMQLPANRDLLDWPRSAYRPLYAALRDYRVVLHLLSLPCTGLSALFAAKNTVPCIFCAELFDNTFRKVGAMLGEWL